MESASAPKNEASFSKEMTGMLKGIAIMLMFVHHFFTFPNWYPGTVDYSSWCITFTRYFCAPTKICVGIFAFITGYFYYYGKKKDFRYSVRKIHQLLLRYWIIALPLILLSIAAGVYTFTPGGFAMEMFGITSDVMKFAWYVYFYIILMFFLPVLIKLLRDKPLFILLFMLVPFQILMRGLLYLSSSSEIWKLVVSNLCLHTQTAVIGYLAARTGLFSKAKALAQKVPSWLRLLLCAALAVGAFMLRYKIFVKELRTPSLGPVSFIFYFNVDIFCVPVLIFALSELLIYIEKKSAGRALSLLGKYSVYMWFWHCMFFGASGKFTKELLYAPQNPFLVYLWGLLICLCLAFVTDKIVNAIVQLRKGKSSDKASEKAPKS